MSNQRRAGMKANVAALFTLSLIATGAVAAEPGQSGTHQRGGGADAMYGQRGGEFTGTFVQIWNPFINNNVIAYSVGTYVDHGTGHIYEGEFSYLPARANGYPSGYYLFQGARIDNEADEVVQGLFVSDATIPNYGIRFRKARPDYLVKLQEEFETSKVQAVADAERQRQKRENMSSFINIIGGLLSIAGGGSNLTSLRSSSLSALTSGLTGKGSSSDILQGVVSQIVRQAGVDPTLSNALGGSTDASNVIMNLAGLNKASQPMTREQYASQLATSVLTPKATTNNSANTVVVPSHKPLSVP